MAILKQKEFWVGAAITAGSAALGLKQGSEQMAQAEEQAKQAEEQQKKASEDMKKQTDAIKQQTKVYEKMAKQNPIMAQSVANMQQQQSVAYSDIENNMKKFRQKDFGNPSIWTWGNIKGAVKGIGKAAWNRKGVLIGAGTTGMGMAGTSYLVNKGIEMDMKKNGIPIPQTPPQPQPAQPQQQQYSNLGGSIMQKEFFEFTKDRLKSEAKSVGSEFKKGIKGNFGPMSLGMNFLFEAPTVSQYMAERKQLIAQARASQAGAMKGMSPVARQQVKPVNYPLQPAQNNIAQKQYSFWGSLIKHPVKKLLNTASVIGGGGGTKGIKNLAGEFNRSGNPILQKTGDFLRNHKKTALVGSIAVGGTVFSTGMNAGENLIKKPLESIDKNAFAYSKSKEQTVEPAQNSSQY